jgi:hypothetical protein
MTNDKEREKAKQKNIAVIENAIAARNKVEKESGSLCFFFLGVFFCDTRARAQISSFHFLCVFQKFLSLFFSSSSSTSRVCSGAAQLCHRKKRIADVFIFLILRVSLFKRSINLSRMTA